MAGYDGFELGGAGEAGLLKRCVRQDFRRFRGWMRGGEESKRQRRPRDIREVKGGFRGVRRREKEEKRRRLVVAEEKGRKRRR